LSISRDLLADKDLTLAEKVIIPLFRENPGYRIRDLADGVGLSERQVKRIMASLVKKGHLLKNGRFFQVTYCLEQGDILSNKVPMCPVEVTDCHDNMSPTAETLLVLNPVPSSLSTKTVQEQEKNYSPPINPPPSEKVKLHWVSDPVKLEAMLKKVDLIAVRTRWEPLGINIDAIWDEFRDTILHGTAKRPVPNPYKYVNFGMALAQWCAKRVRDGPRSHSQNEGFNRPEKEDRLERVIREQGF
jgi:hypothetical protein